MAYFLTATGGFGEATLRWLVTGGLEGTMWSAYGLGTAPRVALLRYASGLSAGSLMVHTAAPPGVQVAPGLTAVGG